MKKVQCYNLTNTGIEMTIDGVRYTMLPKGKKDDKKKLYDNCEMTLDHASSSMAQAYILGPEPKIKVVALDSDPALVDGPAKIPVQSLDKKELANIKNGFTELEKKVQELQQVQKNKIAEITKKIDNKDTEMTKKMEETSTKFNASIETLKASLDKLQKALDQSQEVAKKGKGRQVDNLFSK